MKIIELNMYQAAAAAGLVLLLGRFISNRFFVFKKYCIPDPVVGGVVFAVMHLIFRQLGILEISMDTTLQTFFMLIFYTGVGFTASFRLLKSGGKMVFIFLVLTIGMCILQNAAGAGIAGLFHIDPRIGLMTGSIPMVGGHATATAFAPVFEAEGVAGAEAVGIASATYGLVMGCLIGGPIATRRIRQYHLHSKEKDTAVLSEQETGKKETAGTIDTSRFLNAMLFLVIATGAGTLIYGQYAGCYGQIRGIPGSGFRRVDGGGFVYRFF